MQTSRKIMNMFGSFLSVKVIVVTVASLTLFPLMASAATVEVWQGDNFFTNVINGVPEDSVPSPDPGIVTVTTIGVGDTVKWTNHGTTEHTTTNADDFANGVFEGAIWDSLDMGVGETFDRTFNEEGTIPYLCKIHGSPDMEGTIIVVDGGGGNGDPTPSPTSSPTASPTPSPTPTDPGTKSFTFECDRPFVDWIAGLELLEMELGEEVGCTLTLTNPRLGVAVKVLNAKIFRNSVRVDPLFCETDENGQCEFTMEAVTKGINWTAWGVARNSDNEIVFDKSAYDNGTSWGSAVMVK